MESLDLILLLNPCLMALTLGSLQNILYVALGLGMVIFFHELGHFAVAKWCDVHVEQFSIGFGPAILAKRWGETVYALRAIPFGGYVQMLGQDDADPSQLTSEEIAADPRSFSSKPVWQRMAIISAGVIMNLITGLIFCAIAFAMGVESVPAIVGSVEPGHPAWVAGLERGDKIEKMGGRTIRSFEEVSISAALSTGPIDVEGRRRDDTPFKTVVVPDTSGNRPSIGVSFSSSLRLMKFLNGDPTVMPGTPAASAEPPLQGLDLITHVDDVEVKSFQDLEDRLVSKGGETVTLTVRRPPVNAAGVPDLDAPGEEIKSRVGPGFFRTLGLSMDTGPVTAVRLGSPAQKAGFLAKDKIVKVGDRAIGTALNPLRLPDELSQMAGKEIEITVARQKDGGGNQEVVLKVTPESSPGWLDAPLRAGDALAIPAIGVAIQVVPVVLSVDPGSPAEAAGIKPGQRILKLALLPHPDEGSGPDAKTVEVDLGSDKEKNVNNWAFAFVQLQRYPLRKATLTIKEDSETRTLDLEPVADKEWPYPRRGFAMYPARTTQQAKSFSEAFKMGYANMEKSVLNIYMTLRSLFTGHLSVFELHGPLGIARAAYEISKLGISSLLIFLGFLSANLAVINFLPIPMLDGGHMVFLGYEAITRRKPNEKVQIAATYAGMAFVLGLMLFVICLDLFVHKF
ncbi:Putative zinc metalloprotease [Planctopirus ephydatiae]|uniref:Zinc metalloprotease n=1 Tax=Planctopirus ephydatiae TaxID=2528019 RepID=A0A518GU36_9PLAN|nr:site-2 protease family protein [Planctopirus ephydatiae]QDV32093.1 Putative zinc metalloprotease [Planctopirus ephydatiae]